MRRPARIALQALAVGGLYAFLLWILAGKWEDLRRYDFPIRWGLLAASTALLLAGFSLWIVLWYALTRRLRASLPPGPTAAAYGLSMFARYVPGKVWMFVARYFLYRRADVPRGRIGAAMGLEAFFMIAGPATVMLGASVFSDLPVPETARRLAVALLVAGLLLIHPRIVERALNVALRLARRDPVRIELRYGEMLGFWAAYCAVNLVHTAAFHLLIASVHPLPVTRFPDVCLAATATGLVAMAALFAPAGAGVREAGLFATLRLFLPDSIAVVAALLNRVWATAAELALVGAILLVTRAPRWREIRSAGDDLAEDKT